MTALMIAAKAGHSRVVATLLRYGANLNITNRVSDLLSHLTIVLFCHIIILIISLYPKFHAQVGFIHGAYLCV